MAEVGLSSLAVEGSVSARPYSQEDSEPAIGKHRDYYWVVTPSGFEGQHLEAEEVVKKHGVPEHIVVNHLREELKEEEAVKSLPFALILVIFYALMNFSHDTQAEVRSVEEAIDFDITENANFAFSSPGNMGFKNFEDVNSYADFWSWMNKGMTAVYFIKDRPVSEDSGLDLGPLPFDEAKYYLWHNRKIGPMRLLKEKVAPMECQNKDMRNAFNLSCSMDRQLDLTLDPTDFDVATFEYDPSNTDIQWLHNATFEATLRQLETAEWLNKETYRIQVSFLTYNGGKDLLTMTNIHFLFARSGHIWKRLTHRTLKLDPYNHWLNYLWEILFYGHITCIFLNELFEVCKSLRATKGKPISCLKEYFGFWNCVDWVSIIMAYAMLGVWIIRYFKVKELEKDTLEMPGTLASCDAANYILCSQGHYTKLYATAETAGNWIKESNLLGAFYPVCIMLRLFKAFQAQPRLALVAMTLYNSSGDLAHFGIVFVAAFLSFVVMSVALFGREMTEFADFSRAVMTLFRALVGDFSYDEMAQNNRAIAFIFMAIFQVAMFLIMLNMLVAIVMDVYADTKSSLMKSQTLWEECYEIMNRAWENRKGVRMPFNKILDKYQKSRGDSIDSTQVISVDDFLRLVPGLSREQAELIFNTSAEDWAKEHHKPVELPEVLSSASMAAEWAREVAEELPNKLHNRPANGEQSPITQSQGSVGGSGGGGSGETGAIGRPMTAEEVAENQNVTLEDIFYAAGQRLEIEYPAAASNSNQVAALKRILASLQLLATDSEATELKTSGIRGLGVKI